MARQPDAHWTLHGPRGVSWEVRSNDPPPQGWPLGWWIERRQRRGKIRILGPNYDGTPASIQAAYRYEVLRPSIRASILVYMIRNAGQWTKGRELVEWYGTDALTRLREIRRVLGWPVIMRGTGKATHEYCMDLAAPSPPVKFIRRRPR
jgi:hypothetical protein